MPSCSVGLWNAHVTWKVVLRCGVWAPNKCAPQQATRAHLQALPIIAAADQPPTYRSAASPPPTDYPHHSWPALHPQTLLITVGATDAPLTIITSHKHIPNPAICLTCGPSPHTHTAAPPPSPADRPPIHTPLHLLPHTPRCPPPPPLSPASISILDSGLPQHVPLQGVAVSL